jgi:hypothetical protein
MSGPAPVYQPVFPLEFVEEAKRVAGQRTVAHRRWQRARLVLLLEEDRTISSVEAGKEVGLSDQAVRIWRRRWSSGDFSLDDKPGRGRKPGFSPLGSVGG